MLKNGNKYLRLAANGVLFISLVFLLDFLAGQTLRNLYFRSKSGLGFHMTYAMDSTDAEIVILGASRAVRHYVPQIIEDSLNMTCYNTGYDGNYLINSAAIFRSIISRYEPEAIILDLLPFEMLEGEAGYEQMNRLLPYYANKESLHDIIRLKSKHENLKFISRTYPYNSTLVAVIMGNIRTEQISLTKGYIPLHGIMKDTSQADETDNDRSIDPVKIEALSAIGRSCREHGVNLVIIQSPLYARIQQGVSVEVLNEMTDSCGAEFWNFVNDTVFMKPEYFYDKMHLNDAGAHEFTAAVASRLKAHLYSR